MRGLEALASPSGVAAWSESDYVEANALQSAIARDVFRHYEQVLEDLRAIGASLKQWDRLGTGAWCGYSFSWMSCLRARVGDAVLVSGSLGDHGVAIMSKRENLSFDAPIESDTAALNGLIAAMLATGADLRPRRKVRDARSLRESRTDGQEG